MIKDILAHYSNISIANSKVLDNLSKILYTGHLSGTGKMVILPVDQGFEHGPDRSFIMNADSYDPLYHITLAIDAGLNAFAAPLGMLECVADHIHKIPCILKLNSSNSLNPNLQEPNQAMTSTVEDAIRLGCSAVGMTIYPGSAKFDNMLEQARDVIRNARASGLPTVIWSYPRGRDISKEKEIALETISYAAHIAALIGAHIIKVKIPSLPIDTDLYKNLYRDLTKEYFPIEHVIKAAFSGKRLVVFSGGVKKDTASLLEEVNNIKLGKGNGSIIGRNIFQRPREEALQLLSKIIEIYKK